MGILPALLLEQRKFLGGKHNLLQIGLVDFPRRRMEKLLVTGRVIAPRPMKRG